MKSAGAGVKRAPVVDVEGVGGEGEEVEDEEEELVGGGGGGGGGEGGGDSC